MKKSIEKNTQTNNAENTTQKKWKTWWLSQKSEYHIEKERYHWHINLQDSKKARMCFQSWCINMKVIKICLEEYQIMIKKARVRFALKIQKFESFRKLMKKNC